MLLVPMKKKKTIWCHFCGENVPQTWFRLKVKSNINRNISFCVAHPFLWCGTGAGLQSNPCSYDELSCASGFTCSPSTDDDGREVCMNLKTYSSTSTLGWNERNPRTRQKERDSGGRRQESPLCVYILFDSLKHMAALRWSAGMIKPKTLNHWRVWLMHKIVNANTIW